MFKNFYIKDLFEVINNPQLDKENFTFSESAEYPYFTRTENNNGILGYVEYLDEEHKIKGNSLAVGMISMRFHYMHHDFYAGQFTKTLIPKFQGFNEKLAMYFMAILNKHSEYYQSFLVRHFKDKVSGTVVSLPVIESPDFNHTYTVDDIDFEYMQERVAELEQERVAELDAYLAASGLDDYELTDEDKVILSLSPESASDEAGASEADFGNGQVVFKAFKVGELFDIHPTNTYKMKNDELFASDGTTPVLSNSSVNNGISGYCGLTPIEQGGMITFSDTTTGADTMFYQSSPFIGYPHVQGMYPYQPDKWNEKCCLYVISRIRKSAGNGWSYAVKFNRVLVKELSIELPVIASPGLDHECKVDDINFDYMERYIRAIEKLAIADVAKYKDKITDTTKQLIVGN